MAPQKRPRWAPFLCWGTEKCLFCQWVQRSSRLKLMLCPQKKRKLSMQTGTECDEIQCHCPRRGVMLSLPVLVELLRLLGVFLGSSGEHNFRTERVWPTESRIRKFLIILGGDSHKTLWNSHTTWARAGRFSFLIKLSLLTFVLPYLAAEMLHFVPLYIQLYYHQMMGDCNTCWMISRAFFL